MNINVYLTPNNMNSQYLYSLPKIEFINFVDSRNYETTYCNSHNNWHHFDYKGADNYFKDIICKYENLPYDSIKENIDVKDFCGFKYNVAKDIDVVYKDVCGINIETNNYEDLTLYDNKLITDDYIKKSFILFSNNINDFTLYHKQFIGSHIECKIINKKSLTDKKLLLITDFMSIPMIPYLTTYFREIYQVDARNNARYQDISTFDNIFCVCFTGHPINFIRQSSYIYQCIYKIDIPTCYYQMTNKI